MRGLLARARVCSAAHPWFADRFLNSLDKAPKEDVLNDPKLTVKLEVVIASDGHIARMGVVTSSGQPVGRPHGGRLPSLERMPTATLRRGSIGMPRFAVLGLPSRIMVVVAETLFLAGCAPSVTVRTMTGPNGESAFYVSCRY